MKRLFCFVGILLVFVSFSSVHAKPMKCPFLRMPLRKWWKSPAISSELKLTEEEKKELNKLFIETKNRLIDLKAQIEKEHLKLKDMLESEKIDEKKVIAQFDRLQGLRSKLVRTRFLYVLKIRKILGLERFKLLKKLMRKKMQERKKHMHGRKHGMR